MHVSNVCRAEVLGPKCDAGMSCKDVQWDSSICQDGSQWCKAAAVLDRAFQEKDFDWLVQGYEDDYVNTDNIKNLLQKRDPSEPVVYAGFGCASWGALKEVGYSNQSIADFHICPAVLEHGGLCGGSGIIFSRAAVDRLFADGREAFWRRVYSYPSTIQCDIGTGTQDSALHVRRCYTATSRKIIEKIISCSFSLFCKYHKNLGTSEAFLPKTLITYPDDFLDLEGSAESCKVSL